MKLIIVPKDKEAEDALEFDEAKEAQLIKLVLQDNEFYELHQNGIFELINSSANVNIDDFESEEVTDENQLSNVISDLMKKGVPENIKSKTEQIIFLFKEAIERRTGVYFYF
jgi:hypothetical protein